MLACRSGLRTGQWNKLMLKKSDVLIQKLNMLTLSARFYLKLVAFLSNDLLRKYHFLLYYQ